MPSLQAERGETGAEEGRHFHLRISYESIVRILIASFACLATLYACYRGNNAQPRQRLEPLATIPEEDARPRTPPGPRYYQGLPQ